LPVDFGLRNISSVLRTAGIKRRAQKKISEMYALVQALRAVNSPKLVTEDATLFNSLIEDLFPQQPQGNLIFFIFKKTTIQYYATYDLCI
jgi:hypothetical protein